VQVSRVTKASSCQLHVLSFENFRSVAQSLRRPIVESNGFAGLCPALLPLSSSLLIVLRFAAPKDTGPKEIPDMTDN
jgi:hypothetical protein